MRINRISKTIIYSIGVLCILLVVFLNLVFIANISNSLDEKVDIEQLGIIVFLPVAIITAIIYLLGELAFRIKLKKEYKSALLFSLTIIYIFFQIIWINYVKISPVADQNFAYKTAVDMYKSKAINPGILKYLEIYPQQLTLAFLWNIIFKITHNIDYQTIQYINAISNGITLIMIYKITNLIGNEYKVNKKYSIIIYMGFLTLPLLSTFVYGDELGLALAMSSIYFIMKYTNSNKTYLALISSILMAIGCMARMNNMIMIIAITIYLVLDLFKEQFEMKRFILKLLIIFAFIIISILPSQIIKSTLIKKYELNKENKFPAIGYVYMGMVEGTRNNGWYNDESVYIALSSKENMYSSLKERTIELYSKPSKVIYFYTRKITSMWAENTYASLWYNQSFNSSAKKTEVEELKDKKILKYELILKIWQKAIIINIFLSTLIVLIQNRKKINNEVLLLLLVFMGGFLFHIMWEAKSRYIIPYIVALIPITSIKIKEIKFNSNKT